MTEIEKIVILTAGDCSFHIKTRWGKSRKDSGMRCMKRLDIGDVLARHFQSNSKQFNYSHGQFTEYVPVKQGQVLEGKNVSPKQRYLQIKKQPSYIFRVPKHPTCQRSCIFTNQHCIGRESQSQQRFQQILNE